MITFLSTLPGIIGIVISLGAVVTVIIGGVFYILGLIKNAKDIDKKKSDDQDDRLIKILQTTVDTLERKVDDQKKWHDKIIDTLTTKIDQLTKKVDQLESENLTLTKVLQGRDDQTQIFYRKAFEAMELASKTHSLLEVMNKNHTDLMRTLLDHLKPGVTINNQQPPQQSSAPPNSTQIITS